jgi:transcriptional regulator with XRE-family HTH domain
MKKTVCHPLRILRTQQNLTIEQLAREANVSTATIWRAEHSHTVNAESRRRLCAFFGMTSQGLGLIDEYESAPQATHHVSYKDKPSFSPGVSLTNRDFLMRDRLLADQEPPHDRDAFGREASSRILFTTSRLSYLLEQHWTPDSLLEALQVLLPTLTHLPSGPQQNLLEKSARDIRHLRQAFSPEKSMQLQHILGESIKQVWQFYQTAQPVEVLTVVRSLQMLLQHLSPLLPEVALTDYRINTQNLVGASFYLFDQVRVSEDIHRQAYREASEGKSFRNIIQASNWLAIDANRRGRYLQAIDHITEALHLLDTHGGSEYRCTRAHLLANWALNEAYLREFAIVEEKLSASAELLESQGPNDEFNAAIWHQIAGNCALFNGRYTQAIYHLRQSRAMLPRIWLVRRALTLIPLAEAYVHKRDKEASLEIGQEAADIVNTINSAMLLRRFFEYQQILMNTFPRDQQVQSFTNQSLVLQH